MRTIFFNAHHAPMGAFSTFTLGCVGAKGGFGLEQAGPADQSVFVGLETREGGVYETLPFFEGAADERERYAVEGEGEGQGEGQGGEPSGPSVRAFAEDEVERVFRPATDSWSAGDLELRILSPIQPIPEPLQDDDEDCRLALVPAVLAELRVDNSQGERSRRVFLGYSGNDPYAAMRHIEVPGGAGEATLRGVGQGRITAIATAESGVTSSTAFTLGECLDPKRALQHDFSLGPVGCVYSDVAPGTKRTLRFVLCFYRGGIVTTGLDTRYWYTRYFEAIEDVASFALSNYDTLAARADEADETFGGPRLNEDQRFQLTLALRSYYGSTQLLEHEGRPLWVVNEGEYRMMNTFDLTVDHVFHEACLNPWTIRNVLDLFVSRYSYRDEIHLPGDAKAHPGGLSFTHDMGVGNCFSPEGRSSYELAGLDGCFSHMTHEQLVNWVLCAGVYLTRTDDSDWREDRLPVLRDCLDSLEQRDHPDPEQRNGLMGLDSSRTAGGAEITTYDSLDTSLGQARNNLYLAVKTWAAYVVLERLLGASKDNARAQRAGAQAERLAATILEKVSEAGHIPAVFEAGNDSRIIPAIEGLVFPLVTGCPEALDPTGRFGALIRALQRHLELVLTDGVCLFDDGGWKLSSTSDNSWLSKIYLCQFVARRILDLTWDEQGRRADAAHVAWLQRPENAYLSWSDQMVAGVAKGSRYYPRGVTSVLWLEE